MSVEWTWTEDDPLEVHAAKLQNIHHNGKTTQSESNIDSNMHVTSAKKMM